MIGHLATSGYGFSIGGGYIEYGYGWDWIRQKMIGHSRMPPMGWFIGYPTGYPDRCHAVLCIPLASVVVLVAVVFCLMRWGQALLSAEQSLPAMLGWFGIAFSMCYWCALSGDRWVLEFAVGIATCVMLAIPVLVRIRNRHACPAGRCQTCGYNLFGNVSGICPECGTAIDDRAKPKPGSASKEQPQGSTEP